MYDLFTNAEGAFSDQSFYNTTHEKGETLEVFHRKADRQDMKVLNAFSIFLKLSPEECWKLFYFQEKGVPLTSIRRSITNLTKAGKLVKTNEKRIGIYGRPEYIWEIC